MSNKLKGLLLVGGKSTRMGESKADLCYRENTPEWQRILSLMQNVCEEVYVCCRDAQKYPHSCIIDSGNGPLNAIAEADVAHPGYSWLVVACDMPLLDTPTLAHLVENRDTSTSGTHYMSSIDGMPEPLCSIYEPQFFPAIHKTVSEGRFCPRDLIKNSDSKLIPLLNRQSLMNANTPAEKLEVEAILSNTVKIKTVQLRYFAQLRELANKDDEAISTQAVTPAGLFEEVKALYKFPHKQKQLMVAINEEFSPWDATLREGDEVVFIPPVAGG